LAWKKLFQFGALKTTIEGITQPAAETVVVIFACDKSVFFKIVFSLFNSNKLY
jgi:hypothetical protein